jgi:hypothetical protein
MLDIAEECDRCPAITADLTPLGDYLLCPRCFREAIADIELMPYQKEENTDPWMEAGE